MPLPVAGEGFDELSAGVEATRRGTYPDDQKVVWSPAGSRAPAAHTRLIGYASFWPEMDGF